VVFDQTKLESSLDTIVPDLALSWAWDAPKTRVTFKLVDGGQVARRQTVHGQGRSVHVRSRLGLTESDDFRKNPRKVWYHNVASIEVNGDNKLLSS
jgi:peptide/nickel transport system substrate-binding protein